MQTFFALPISSTNSPTAVQENSEYMRGQYYLSKYILVEFQNTYVKFTRGILYFWKLHQQLYDRR